MPVSLALRGRHAGDRYGEAAWARALAVLHEADRVFSTYRADSYVSRLDRGEIGVAECPPEVAEVLALGELARVQSAGAFDVRRREPGGREVLDPSGVVKGWAVQRAAQALAALADTDVCLSAGGDLVCRVADHRRPAWRIGIEDPHDPSRVVAVVPLRHGALATSALTHRGPHIVDARTGQVPTAVASVTVVADDLTWADIDATAAFAHGADALHWLRGRPNRSAVVVWGDGSVDTHAA
ncbi:MAG: FAD:protein FMN transferase [Nocardioidaceae bacterium]|nr:FAD:protein FMN transferase [Nocardioidaceae bacterium]NUS50684.1 FAD:protein FMN transferase [Nocardioidaceae bacterium]